MMPTAYSRTPNLFIPGLTPEGRPKTHVALPGFWGRQAADHARGGHGDAYLDELVRDLRQQANAPMVGLVLLDSIDNRTGQVLSRTITHNVETDYAINNMLKLFGTGAAVTALGQYMALDTATAAAVMSGSTISSGSQSSIVVGGNTYTAGIVAGNAAASFQAFSSNNGTGQNVTTPGATGPDATYGTAICWSYGTANAEYVSGTTGSATGTSIPITSYTVGKTHTAGDYVVAFPSTKDGPSGAPTGLIVAAGTATTTYTTTAGVGNRKAQLVYTFAAGAYAAASYTGLWIATYASVGAYAASGNYAHVSTPPQVLNSSTSVQTTYVASF